MADSSGRRGKPPPELDATVDKLVTALLDGAPEAQRRARELVHRADDSDVLLGALFILRPQ